jgi:hypothetical protein
MKFLDNVVHSSPRIQERGEFSLLFMYFQSNNSLTFRHAPLRPPWCPPPWWDIEEQQRQRWQLHSESWGKEQQQLPSLGEDRSESWGEEQQQLPSLGKEQQQLPNDGPQQR